MYVRDAERIGLFDIVKQDVGPTRDRRNDGSGTRAHARLVLTVVAYELVAETACTCENEATASVAHACENEATLRKGHSSTADPP